eukprot:scaffold327_cov257-Pinguiococcus_pyrenoidosus.AAC.3
MFLCSRVLRRNDVLVMGYTMPAPAGPHRSVILGGAQEADPTLAPEDRYLKTPRLSRGQSMEEVAQSMRAQQVNAGVLLRGVMGMRPPPPPPPPRPRPMVMGAPFANPAARWMQGVPPPPPPPPRPTRPVFALPMAGFGNFGHIARGALPVQRQPMARAPAAPAGHAEQPATALGAVWHARDSTGNIGEALFIGTESSAEWSADLQLFKVLGRLPRPKSPAQRWQLQGHVCDFPCPSPPRAPTEWPEKEPPLASALAQAGLAVRSALAGAYLSSDDFPPEEQQW